MSFPTPTHLSPRLPALLCPQNRNRCDELYNATKASVEDGVSFLLEQRQRDPYGDFIPRQLYEQLYRGRQAPTFPLNS